MNTKSLRSDASHPSGTARNAGRGADFPGYLKKRRKKRPRPDISEARRHCTARGTLRGAVSRRAHAFGPRREKARAVSRLVSRGVRGRKRPSKPPDVVGTAEMRPSYHLQVVSRAQAVSYGKMRANGRKKHAPCPDSAVGALTALTETAARRQASARRDHGAIHLGGSIRVPLAHRGGMPCIRRIRPSWQSGYH